MTIQQAIQRRLRELIAKSGKSVYRLSLDSGICISTFRSILNRGEGATKITTLYPICEALGITIKDFFDTPLFDMENIYD